MLLVSSCFQATPPSVPPQVRLRRPQERRATRASLGVVRPPGLQAAESACYQFLRAVTKKQQAVRTQGKYQRRRSVHETSSVWGVSQRTERVCLLRAACETRERGVGLHETKLALTPSRLCGALSTYVHPVHESRMSARTFFCHTPRTLPASASAAPTSASAMRTATAAHNVSDDRIIATHMIDCACEMRPANNGL